MPTSCCFCGFASAAFDEESSYMIADDVEVDVDVDVTFVAVDIVPGFISSAVFVVFETTGARLPR